MAEIKIIASDMDGTLLDSQKNQPADFADWVLAHPQYQLVLASGRQYYTLYDEFPLVADQLMYISDNGGFVFGKGQMLYANEMKKEHLQICIQLLEQVSGLHMIFCGAESAYMLHAKKLVEDNGHMYYHHLQFVDALEDCLDQDHIVKIAVFIEENKAEEVFHVLPDLPEEIHAVLSGDSWIDISNRDVSKGTAMERIQEYIGATREETMAFGDYLNDYDLLVAAGESYAMENAHPDLKKIAKYITESNDEDGVMKVLRTL